MRTISVNLLTEKVKELCIEANYNLPTDVKDCLLRCKNAERSPRAVSVLEKILENVEIAATERAPLCQDTGMACLFLEIGQEVQFVDGDLYTALHEGVRQGYKEGYLRCSVVADPLRRVNTNDNTPALIYTDIVPGDKVRLMVAPKGFGSENMSRVKMCRPSDGAEGIKDFVVETAKIADANPCPPIVVGVGIGGSFDRAALLAKKALLRPLDQDSTDPYYAEMEKELLQRINELNIGPQGFGGDTTALKVNIEAFPTHIASLPVAVNINCHVTRHMEVTI